MLDQRTVEAPSLNTFKNAVLGKTGSGLLHGLKSAKP